MAKTPETRKLEQALQENCDRNALFGCEEVTIGFPSDGYGDEIADFVAMHADGTLICYEIKVTMADLKSENKLSWYGDLNYLVVAKSLEQKVTNWNLYIPPWVGVYSSARLERVRIAKRRILSEAQRAMLKNSLIRTLYNKMREARAAGDLHYLRTLLQQVKEGERQLETFKEKVDRTIWTVDDYTRYYRLNHQDPSYSLEQDAKAQREAYRRRKAGLYTWRKTEQGWQCPVCGRTQAKPTPYCASCGSDLRPLE